MINRIRQTLAAVLLLTCAALFMIGCGPNAADGQEEIERVTVERGMIAATVNATGFVEPAQTLPVTFLAQGRVSELLVSEGDTVDVDQPLARLESADLELGVRQAEAALAAAEAQLEALSEPPSDSDRAAAEAALASAQAARDALPEAATEAQLAAADAQIAQAQAQLDRLLAGTAESQIAASEAQVEQARIGLEQAQRALERAELRAPIAGVVATLALQVGSAPPAAQPALTLVDLSTFTIEIAVDEVDIVEIAVGDAVTVQVEALAERAITGAIERIAPVANPAQGVVTYPVTVRLEGEDAPGLRPGMSATVDIVTETREGVLLAPSGAISVDRSTGQLYVEREEEGEPARVDVTVGLRDDENSELLSGAEEGQTLLIRSASGSSGSLFGGN